jgi:hypothetical protein
MHNVEFELEGDFWLFVSISVKSWVSPQVGSQSSLPQRVAMSRYLGGKRSKSG